MSLYADYLHERTDDQMFENGYGFVIYKYIDDTVYIIDIYIKPDMRRKNLAASLADMVVEKAKGKGCKALIGSVMPSAKGSTDSLKVLLGYGMTLVSSGDNCIFFRKDI